MWCTYCFRYVVDSNIREKIEFTHSCKVMTAAAPPPAAVLQSMQESGFELPMFMD